MLSKSPLLAHLMSTTPQSGPQRQISIHHLENDAEITDEVDIFLLRYYGSVWSISCRVFSLVRGSALLDLPHLIWLDSILKLSDIFTLQHLLILSDQIMLEVSLPQVVCLEEWMTYATTHLISADDLSRSTTFKNGSVSSTNSHPQPKTQARHSLPAPLSLDRSHSGWETSCSIS